MTSITAKYRSISSRWWHYHSNFALKCLIPKLLRGTVLLRYCAITARSVLSPSFLLRYYGIMARYFTLLTYWDQSYCKSKYFILITLLQQGTLLFFLIGIKATIKASGLFLLCCYSSRARYSTLLIGIKVTLNARVSLVLHYYAITARYFTLLSYWHQSYCKSKCFILITLLCYYGKVRYSSYWHQSNCKRIMVFHSYYVITERYFTLLSY